MAGTPFQTASTMTLLGAAPITPGWIRAGAPVARAGECFRSADGTCMTAIWECTAGMFDWTYSVDETIHILEGSVILRDCGNVPTRLGPGDVVFLPKGAQVSWTVESYVKKLAFIREVTPNPLRACYQFARRLKRAIRGVVSGSTFKPAIGFGAARF